jgi:hypothetical protein
MNLIDPQNGVMTSVTEKMNIPTSVEVAREGRRGVVCVRFMRCSK